MRTGRGDDPAHRPRDEQQSGDERACQRDERCHREENSTGETVVPHRPFLSRQRL
ncbi:hypothetical protein [Haladaptatus sp. W1]|uniref:hypothetical protein n=1 Tax=Haladaptatus sp. W1 TaxID=1897478 RepID=UPI001586BF2D|nr:hypothetical protein [Haladaptatus sp. W1]